MSTKKPNIQHLGGVAVSKKHAPPQCKLCGKLYQPGHPYMSYLGHLGLHGLADKYFMGNIQLAQKRLRENGLAKQDPAPWNDAWPKYKEIKS